MKRRDRYARVDSILSGIKRHAGGKGDGVLADKVRKIEIQMKYLKENDASDMEKENV